MPNFAGIVIEIVGDAKSYIRSAEQTIAMNKAVAGSTVSTSTAIVESSALSAKAQVAGTAKAIAATEQQIAAFKALEAQGVKTYGLIAAAQAKLARLQGVNVGVAATPSLFGRARSAVGFGAGFLGVTLGAEAISHSIHSAEELEAAQRALDVAIEHTGGNVAELSAQYLETAKAAAQFGVNEVQATEGLKRATVLTGDAVKAQRAYQEALVVSKALGKDFNAVLIATSKAQGGMTSALRRLGVMVDTNATSQEQYNAIMERYGGQAEANTTATEKFSAAADNLSTSLGNTLLPALTPVVEGWAILLDKMQEMPRAVKDVIVPFRLLGDVLHGIHDRVTADDIERYARNHGLMFHGPIPPQGARYPFGTFGGPETATSSPVGQTFFRNTPAEMIAQANAALTKSMQDDVVAAKAVVARIKRGIEHNKYAGKGLIAALQAEAAALGIIWAAEDEAAQKRAEAAQKAKDKIEAQIQDSIDPLRLEVALSRAQALGKPLTKILKELRQAAYKALASGKLSLEQQKEAWDQITSLNEQLTNQASAQAKGIRAANTRILTADLGLTRAQRDELRARLASLDARGRSLHHAGVGAFGYEIGNNGRPIQVRVDLDGRKVAENTTRHQQRRHRRNSSQRRGPNTGG